MAFRALRLALPSLAMAVLALASSAQVYCECGLRSSPCGNMHPGPLQAGCVNSLGLRAFLGPIGTTSLAADDLVLSSFNMPVDVPRMPLDNPATTGAMRERMPGITKPRATMIAKTTTMNPAANLM